MRNGSGDDMQLPELLLRSRQPLDPTGEISARARELPGPGTTLDFDLESQKAEFWCWVAVASGVSRHYDVSSPWSQCSIANAELQTGEDCCFNHHSSACNRMGALEFALKRTGNYNGKRNGPIAFNDVVAQIGEARRVIGCAITWDDGTNHFVVLHGFSVDFNNVPWVAVEDPDPTYGGYSEYPYDAFVTSYRTTGRWRVSYATKPEG